ncbi:MAG TPA: prephenate dehydrogenase/arogenate dehydrogenase family protein [Burkholderiales bacterium]|nr:prephenate dehydrogenase/arogenate dehydrogenase family protein [Burkholderiales bacterium]
MAQKFNVGTVVIVGVGLIGGSFALALKKARAVKRIIGVGRTRKNLATALRLGIIDEIARDAGEAVRQADLVLLGVPVGQMGQIMARIAPHLPQRAVITDAGSTKQDVIEQARRFLGEHFKRFVPGHPIAGTENSGAAAAFPGLYTGRKVILTPQPETANAAVRFVREAWRACGAQVVRFSASEHDMILGAVSHLPHVAAYALLGTLARRKDAAKLLGYSGAGLRDTVRIAGSSPEMWRDICIANRDTLLTLLDDYMDELELARAAIESSDGDALAALFERARAARRRWLLTARA